MSEPDAADDRRGRAEPTPEPTVRLPPTSVVHTASG